MPYLIILLREPLSLGIIAGPPVVPFTIKGRLFEKESKNDDQIVFYDWLVDSKDRIRGLEIHLDPNEPLLKTAESLSRLSLVEINCFLRVWFTGDRSGVPHGIEAFGDIHFFHSANELAIAVGLDHWLSESQRQCLVADSGLINEENGDIRYCPGSGE